MFEEIDKTMSKLMEDNYVFTSYEVSKQLNELKSFKEFTSKYHDYYYDNNQKLKDVESCHLIKKYNEIPAITQSQAQKFFREIYNIIIEPIFDEVQNDGFMWLLNIYYNNIDIINEQHKLFGNYCDSYEEILEIGIKEALNLIDDGTI